MRRPRRPALIKIRSAIKSSRYLRLVYERGAEGAAAAGRGVGGTVITYLCVGGSATEKLPSRRRSGGRGSEAARHARCAPINPARLCNQPSRAFYEPAFAVSARDKFSPLSDIEAAYKVLYVRIRDTKASRLNFSTPPLHFLANAFPSR